MKIMLTEKTYLIKKDNELWIITPDYKDFSEHRTKIAKKVQFIKASMPNIGWIIYSDTGPWK